MHDVLPIIIAFSAGYLAGLFTKHELLEWVKRHGSKKNK